MVMKTVFARKTVFDRFSRSAATAIFCSGDDVEFLAWSSYLAYPVTALLP